jgi:CheY-like chemotaxis protein
MAAKSSSIEATVRTRVLVVDDEVFLTEVLDIGLGRLGFAVTPVNDPLEALALFERTPASFDAIISDQIMPRMTGLVLLSRIRALSTAIPFILCSGFADDASESTAAAAGANAFFMKPVSPDILANKLRQLTGA